jgi:membrane protein insertase Oxa1/YidC/SpoIIIJ
MLTRSLRRLTPSVLDTLPTGSPSWLLLERCLDYSAERGASPSEYSPWMLTDLMQNTFGIVHDCLPPELGWLGAVAVSAVAVRSLIFPLTLQSIREGRLKSALLPRYSEMIREMSEAKVPSAGGNSSRKAADKLQTLQREYMEFTAKYGNVALKGTLASAIQIPMIMTGIVACNGIAMHPELFPAIALEAPLWLESASLPDPLYVLPAINGLLVWGNMKYFGSVDATATPKQRGKSSAESDEQSKRIKDLITSRMGRESAERTSAQIDSMYKSKMMKYGKQMFPVLVFGITSKFPAITLVYTISNILGAMVQNWLVANPRFQTTFAIPAQARKSADEVAVAMARADEIRKKIIDISNARKSQRHQKEELAKLKFKRRA